MDWAKVGQAFQGGANVLAGGLMDKYQRKKDLEDWAQKTNYAQGIEEQQRKAQEAREWLEKRYSEFPEMKDFHSAAEQGDPEAQKKLYTFAGAWDKINRAEPLADSELQEIFSLPPMTKGKLLNLDLKNKWAVSDRETKRKQDEATLASTVARTEREKATTKKALEDTQDYSDLYGDYAIEKKVRDTEAKQKEKDLEAIVAEINSLNSRIMSKKAEAERAGATKTQAGFGSLIEELNRLSSLRDDALAKRDSMRTGDVSKSSQEQARQKWAAEAATKPETPTNVVEKVALTPEDKIEIEAAMKARPDLSQDEIIRQYLKYKQQKK